MSNTTEKWEEEFDRYFLEQIGNDDGFSEERRIAKDFIRSLLTSLITRIEEGERAYRPVSFIVDLYELKRTLMRPFSNREYVEPNITYSVIETLIATFCDKYKVRYEELEEEMRKREMRTLSNPPSQV